MKDAVPDAPVSLTPDIRNSQNELKSAILKHQFILNKLKESPSDVDLQKQIEKIQKHIFSLGLIQKKLVQKLRKEILDKAVHDKKAPVRSKQLKLPSDVKKLKGSNNSRHGNTTPAAQNIALTASTGNVTPALSLITKPTTKKAESAATGEAASIPTAAVVSQTTLVKDSTSATTPSHSAKRSPSLSPPSYITAITDRISKARLLSAQGRIRKGSSSPTVSEESQDSIPETKPFDAALNSKLQFMTSLGLVTRQVLCELQNRRVERKRRSTANPQFVYGNCVEQPVKRRKTSPNGECGNLVAIDRLVALPNATCLVCSSAKGLLSVCWSCRRAFHWSCISGAPIPPCTDGQLHCPSCRSPSPNSLPADSEYHENTPATP